MGKSKDRYNKEARREIIEWIVCILIAVIMALIVRQFVCMPTVVKETSMLPTLKSGDRLILDRWSITTNRKIERGEIITFEAPVNKKVSFEQFDKENPIACYEDNSTSLLSKYVNKQSYIKRVIAIEGDHLLIENRQSFSK